VPLRPAAGKMESAVVMAHNGELSYGARGSGRDLNTPTSRRKASSALTGNRRCFGPRTPRGKSAAVMSVQTGSDCSTTELPKRLRSEQDSNLRPSA
jgi:hypothetical protein